jgi:hypothetical protein
MIVNYGRSVIVIVNYDSKAFIVQTTDVNKKWCHTVQFQIGLSPAANVIKIPR